MELVTISEEKETDPLTDQKRSVVPSLCEFIHTDNPADPKFDIWQTEIIAALQRIPEGQAILQRIEGIQKKPIVINKG